MIDLLPPNLPPVSNYIDPGTGSLLLFALASSFLAGLYYLKVYWGKVKNFFSRGKSKNDKELLP